MAKRKESSRCLFGRECYRLNPDHFSKFSHPHLDEDDSSEASSTKRDLWRKQREIIGELNGEPDQKKPKVPEQKMDRRRKDVKAKLERGQPLNIFYNKVRDSPETLDSDLSLYFSDLLHPSLGSIRSTLQMTFMVELNWLMMNYEATKNDTKPLTVLYDKIGGVEDDDGCDLTEKYPNITLQQIKPKYPYGTHHTKIMVVVYEDNSVRIVLGTSNLIGDDWLNRTQGLWVSPKCPPGSGDSPTGFKRDLVDYLEQYELGSVLRPFISAIQSCDFSQVNVFFLASVPGSYDAPCRYGQSQLESLLKQHCPGDETWPIVMQCSSIGSLGKTAENSFFEELSTTLNGGKKPDAAVNFVYPTLANVLGAYGGPAYASGCLPYVKSSHDKQPWLKDYMYVWKADDVHRTKAMPHIKTYAKLRGNEAAFFALTSSNLSKAAWGGFSKTRSKIFIKSHEAGVLFLPKFTHDGGKTYYKLGQDLTLPYDWPLTKYSDEDQPFYHEM